MENKILMLVGNGFNNFISSNINNSNYTDVSANSLMIARNYGGKNTIDISTAHTMIEELSKSLKQYCTLLDDITIDASSVHNHKAEFFLEKLYNFTKNVNAETIIDDFEEAIKKQIIETLESANYKKLSTKKYMLTNVSLRSIFWTQDKYFSMLLNELFTHHNTPSGAVTIATTNYDRNTKAVLCESYASKDIFENYIALHGDSKSKIICTAPNNKHSRIIQDSVLSNAFSHFETAVKEATIVILLGIVLASDPHILSLLNKRKNAHFIIIDANRDRYIRQNYYQSTYDEDGNLQTQGFDFLY